MEVDDFAIHKLNDLKVRVLCGEVTDWPGATYRHITSMTCNILIDHRMLLPSWQWQLEQILHKCGAQEL